MIKLKVIPVSTVT